MHYCSASAYSNVLAGIVFDAVNSSATSPGFSYRIRVDSSQYAPGVGQRNVSSPYLPDGSPAPPDTTSATYRMVVVPVQVAVE